MRKAIESFHEQFGFRPIISRSSSQFEARLASERFGALIPKAGSPELLMRPAIAKSNQSYRNIIIAGMGGSALAGALLKNYYTDLDIIVHRNYGLPRLAQEKFASSLVIANSYSGNTEETIDSFLTALDRGVPVIAIATGGKLLEIARHRNAPFIQIPVTVIQPRLALGYSVAAVLKAIGKDDDLDLLYALEKRLRPADDEPAGKALAEELYDKVPVIYASAANEAIAYIWKINFNETGKIPAFYNVLPELNHNEMTGFDAKPSTRELSRQFTIITIRDADDDPRIQKRMDILETMLGKRGLAMRRITISGENFFEKVFSSMIHSEWAAYHLGIHYGVEVEQVPMVEEFKGLMKQ